MFRWKYLVVFLLGMLGIAAGQINVGEATQMSMSGRIGTGYSGGYSDTPGSSSHTVAVNGDGQLTGYYFNPNFLNFLVHPYYGRTQDSTSSVSIGNSSGVSSSTDIFAGSPFPGSVTFSKSSDDTGQYAIPGSTSLVTNANSTGYSIGWAENLKGLPHVNASWSHSGSNSSIVGVEGTNVSDFNSFNLATNYTFAGWPTHFSYTHQSNSSLSPATITGIGTDESGNGSYFQVNTSHPIHSLRGGLSLGYTHNTYDYSAKETDGGSEHGANTSNSTNAILNFSPANRITSTLQLNYNDNVLSSTVLQLLNSGTVPVIESPGPLRSLSYSGDVSWNGPHGFMVDGGVTRIQQSYQGTEYDSTQAYGNLNYNYNGIFGSLYLTAGMYDSATQEGNTTVGYFGTATFDRMIRGYNVTASVTYSQNENTLASFITTSGVGYSTGVSHKIRGATYWHANFVGGHSVLSTSNNENHQERIFAGISRRRVSISSFWGQTHQSTIQTASGLVEEGAANSLLGGMLSMFDSTNFGISGSIEPIRHMTLTASFSQEHGNSVQQSEQPTRNKSKVEYLLLRYPYRKIYFTASYNRVLQGITSSGNPLHPVTSYSFGVYRSIKLF